MGEVYRFLGLSVGCIQSRMNQLQRQRAYQCDITYGTNSEFGFDYLRDNLVNRISELPRAQGRAASGGNSKPSA